MDKIYIYEEEGYKNLLPLVYLRPVFDLYCGIYTSMERIQKLYPEAKICPLSRFTIGLLRHSVPRNDTESPTLFINGRAILHSPLPDEEGVFVAMADKKPSSEGVPRVPSESRDPPTPTSDIRRRIDEVVGFRVKSEKLKVKSPGIPITNKFLDAIKKEFKVVEVKATIIKYPWDLIKENELTIIEDIKLNPKSKIQNPKSLGVYLLENEGLIYIGNGVQIKPPTIIEGPCYIGDNSLIDGAKIRRGTTIGKGCRIGGEVEASIFSDFSNKHHEGFVGHSYIGEWVNLGALTTTSDLKNTYGTVKVPICRGEHMGSPLPELMDTKLLKLGSFIGDHTKTGIGTLLDTGSVIGCFVNIQGGGVVPKYIPSFSWGTKDELTEYKLDKAIDVANLVMARRAKELTKEYESKIRKAFELTKNERNVDKL